MSTRQEIKWGLGLLALVQVNKGRKASDDIKEHFEQVWKRMTNERKKLGKN